MRTAMSTKNNTTPRTDARLTMTLAPEHNETPAGTLPDLVVSIKNNTASPVKLWTYMLEHRLISGLTARDQDGVDYGFYPFVPASWAKTNSDETKTLSPGQEIKVRLAVSKLTGWGFVRTGSQPPVLLEGGKTKGFKAGTHTISTVLFPSAAIYVGASGVHDRSYDRRRCEIEDAAKTEIEASASVKFSAH